MEGEFVLFGGAHLGVLAAMCVCGAILVWLGRSDGVGIRVRRIRWGLAVILVLNKLLGLGMSWASFGLSMGTSLPMHLCDWAWACAVVALLVRRSTPYELAYYWGLAGTFQAILTPDLPFGFPNPFFFTFFISHCGLVVAVVFLTLGDGMSPRAGSVWRAFGWLQVYVVATCGVNALFGANYGYLCSKPEGASLLDHMGPWPWYILAAEALALGLFWLLYAPFAMGRGRPGLSCGSPP